MTEPVAVTEKASGAQVVLEGDASLEYDQDFLGTEKAWGIIPGGSFA